jgi:hypothetical protein
LTLALTFAFLAGMFKALRDRDLWHDGPDAGEGTDHTWYESWGWYRAWSDTERYIGPFPLDAWHNFDVACIASAIASGCALCPEIGWWAVPVGLSVALPSKWLFYHVLLMRHPVAELKEYWNERTGGAS